MSTAPKTTLSKGNIDIFLSF